MFWSANVADKIVDAFPMEPIGSDHILIPQKKNIFSNEKMSICIILYKSLFVGLLKIQNSFGLICLR